VLSATSDASTHTATPAGWHPDPLGHVTHRYWDGERWTPYASSDGTNVVIDTDGNLPEPAPPDAGRALALLASVVVLAAIGVFAVWWAGPDDARDPSSFDAAPAPASEDPASPATPEAGDAEPPPGPPPLEDRASRDDDSFRDELVPGWPVSGEPLKVVYLVETSRGEEWEEIIASDPPRSISRGPYVTRYNDGTEVVQCTQDRCVLQDDEWAEAFDYLDSRRSYSPPSEIPNPLSRRIAGRDAICTSSDLGPDTTCWDSQTGVILLVDPGDEAMEPSAFSSTRITATYLGPPEPGDFDLPSEVLPPEEPA
jgi:hypothetical protein